MKLDMFGIAKIDKKSAVAGSLITLKYTYTAMHPVGSAEE